MLGRSPLFVGPHRWLAIALAMALVSAVPALAQQRGDRRDRVGEDVAKSPGGREDLEEFERGEARRRERRATREERERRRDSKRAFRDQSKQEALRLAREQQPELIETPVWEPLALEEGERVDRFVGETSAQIVDGEGERHALDSTLPLRSEVGGEGERVVDLSLADGGAALVPVNPLIETEIAKDLQGGVRIGDEGFVVRLESPSPAEGEAVEDRAFFANALPDSDMVVLPTPKGVQVSLQVRSADAPEQAVLALDLPDGAALRVIAPDTEADGEVPGSAEVVRGDERLAVIQPPLGWDADGEPLEGVRYSAEGDKLVVHYPHRSADVLYPLAIDPQIDRFRVNESGGPDPNGSFLIGPNNRVETASWQAQRAGFGSEGFFTHPYQYDYTREVNNPLYLSANASYYNDGAYAQWIWQAPRQSWINRVDYAGVYINPPGPPVAMCVAEGIYSVTNWNWEPGVIYKTTGPGTSQYFGSSPWIGGSPPNGSCNSQSNDNKQHFSNAPTPGNIAVFQYFAYLNGTRSNFASTTMDGTSVFIEDGQTPTVSATTSPGGWVKSATITTNVNTRDAAPGTPSERGGLGMFVDGLQVPVEGGGTAQQTLFGSCHLRLTRCTEDFIFRHTYSTEGDLNPNAVGNQRMPEGVNNIYGDAYDAIGKPTRYQAGAVKIDRTSPNFGSIAGVTEGELLRDRDYTISASAADALSGAKRVSVSLDGVEKTSRNDCPANTNKCFVSFTLDGGDPNLNEGTHTLTVKATDQVGNPERIVATRTFKVERTKPTFEADGSLLPTDRGWVAKGDQDLVIDAFDDPSALPATGATHIEARIDGNQVGQPVVQECAAGDCEFGAEFDASTDGLAEGPHTLEIIVRDGAGNKADSEPIDFKLERTAPAEPALGGTLWEARDQTLTPGTTYTLTAASNDFNGTVMQSGLGAMDVAVDDDAADVKEQPCALGGCAMARTFSYTPDEEEPGSHTFTVAVTDLAGNESATQFSVTNPEPPEPECQPTDATSPGGPTIPSLNSILALEAFRLRLPGAFRPWIAKDFESQLIKPELDPSDPNLFTATGTIAEMSVDKEESDGATTELWTDSVPICTTPTTVGPDASGPEEVVDGTTTLSALYANSDPGVDTLIRPTPVGSSSLLHLRDPNAQTDFSWNVDLQPGQELRELPGGAVAVIEPVPADSEIITSGIAPPGIPSLAERRAALTDTELYFEQSTGALLRALEEVPDEIVAVIPNPWAVDALDRPVATTLVASGSTVTMSVVKQDLPPTAYPVIASHELIVGDSLDEWEVLESETETAEEPGDAPGAPPIDDEEPTAPPVNIYPDDPADDFVDADPSATDDNDLDTDFDSQDGVQFAEPFAAGRPEVNAEIGLSESAPAVLYNPRRIDLAPVYHRPIVPWRVTGIIDRYNRRNPNDPGDTPQERKRRERFKAEEKRAFLWDSQDQDGARRGWFNIATAPGLGVKAPGKPKVTTDVALQFVRAKVDGEAEPRVTDVRAPRLAQYKTVLRTFLRRYGSVMEDGSGERVGTLAPWNEPNYGPNPTSRRPIRAARYWKAAQAICHPKGANNRCGEVVAGEWAGFPKAKQSGLIRHKGRRRTYERIYEEYILNRSPEKGKQRPRAWGWHNYGDNFAYQRMGKFAPRRRFKWPITSRFYEKYSSGKYNYMVGGDNRVPRRWLTATGVFYHRNCGPDRDPPPTFFRNQCSADVPSNERVRKEVVLFNMRNQSNTLNAMFSRIARNLNSIGRIYYYDLQDVANASSYGGPESVRGRGAGPYDTGLVGSDDDGGDPRYEDRLKVRHFPDGKKARPRFYSNKNQPRLAFCSFKNKMQRVNRPRTCAP